MDTKVPDNYIEISDINTIHKLLYMLLEDFHNICEENNLKYTLDFGSLLGAVRHGGFIPWDDDLDISMPRPDYDKFIEIFSQKYKSSNLVLYEPLSKGYIYPYLKLGLKDTILFEKILKKYAKLSLYIDIFPADGVPKKPQRLKSYKYVEKQRKKIGYCTAIINTSPIWWKKPFVIIRLLKKFWYSLLPISHYINNQLREVAKTNYDSADLVSYRFSTVRGQTMHEMPKEFVENFKQVEFGNQKVWITSLYHEKLTNEYGDYMKLPPVEKRCSNHNYRLYVDKKILEPNSD